MPLPIGKQYQIIAKACKEIKKYDNVIDRGLVLCAYAAVMGHVSETNFLTMGWYSGVNPGRRPIRDLLSYYMNSGIFTISDDGHGLTSLIKNDKKGVQVDKGIIDEVKSIVEEIRKSIAVEQDDNGRRSG